MTTYVITLIGLGGILDRVTVDADTDYLNVNTFADATKGWNLSAGDVIRITDANDDQ